MSSESSCTFPLEERKSLEAERIILRPICKSDALFYLELMQTPKWLQFIGDRGIVGEEACQNYIAERMLSQWERLGMGNYVVQRKSDDALLGCIGVFTRPGLEGVDLGFAFLPQYEKQGYAREGAQRLLHELFTVQNVEYIQAVTKPSNKDSQNLIRKLGFISKGTVELVLPHNGEVVVDDLFGLTLADYLKSTSST